MRTATIICRLLVRVCGLIQISLGLLFWTGNGLGLVPTHMLTGLLLVLSFLTLAVLGGVAGLPKGRVALAIAWGILTVALGVSQTGILPGSFHWIVQVLHLLVGIAAIVQAEALAAGILERRPARQPATR
jgi:hypothetical protein